MPVQIKPQALEDLKTAIKLGHAAVAVDIFGAKALPELLVQDLLEKGYLKLDDLENPGIFASAYGLGQQAGVAMLQKPGSKAHPIPAKPTPQLSEWEQAMAAAARRRGANLILGLGAASAESLANDLLAQEITDARWQRVIRETVAEAVEKRQGVGELKTALFDRLVEDRTRDLDRIAATELQGATNEGIADVLMETEGPDVLVAVIPNPDACPSCMRVYTEGGRPRIWHLRQLPPWGTNRGRKQRDWVATVPPLHPWCFCELVYVPEGWTVARDGTMEPR